jgi:hypothetical protein
VSGEQSRLFLATDNHSGVRSTELRFIYYKFIRLSITNKIHSILLGILNIQNFLGAKQMLQITTGLIS